MPAFPNGRNFRISEHHQKPGFLRDLENPKKDFQQPINTGGQVLLGNETVHYYACL